MYDNRINYTKTMLSKFLYTILLSTIGYCIGILCSVMYFIIQNYDKNIL